MNNSTSYDVLNSFRGFAQKSAGIELPADLIIDGKPQSFQLKSDKPPTRSGGYCLNQQTGVGYVKAYGKQLPFKFKPKKAPEVTPKPTIDEAQTDIETIAPPVPIGIEHQQLSEEKKGLNNSLTAFDSIADDTMPQGYNVNASYDEDGIPTPFDTITHTNDDTSAYEPALLDAVYSKAEKQPQAQPPTKPADNSTFKTISLRELLIRKYVTNWLVKGVIELGNLALFFGDSASGKTFYIMDMCFCIAAGIPFKGKPTKQGNVLYICGEGFSGLQKRFMALFQHYDVMPENLHLSEQPAAFMDLSSARAVMDKIKDIGNVSLIVIDTFHRNMGGGSEDSAADISQFLGNIDTFLKPTGAAVAIIHHSGHGAKERSRGSSSIKAAMDVEYQVVKDQLTNIVTVTNTKMKDWQAPPPACFNMNVVNLFDDYNQPISDEDGELLTSVILEPTDYIPTKGRRLNSRQQDVLDELRKAIEQHGIPPTDDIKALYPDSPYNCPAKIVHLSKWRVLAYKVIAIDGESSDIAEAKKKAFQYCLKVLRESGKVGFYDDYVWNSQQGDNGTKRDNCPRYPSI